MSRVAGHQKNGSSGSGPANECAGVPAGKIRRACESLGREIALVRADGHSFETVTDARWYEILDRGEMVLAVCETNRQAFNRFLGSAEEAMISASGRSRKDRAKALSQGRVALARARESNKTYSCEGRRPPPVPRALRLDSDLRVGVEYNAGDLKPLQFRSAHEEMGPDKRVRFVIKEGDAYYVVFEGEDTICSLRVDGWKQRAKMWMFGPPAMTLSQFHQRAIEDGFFDQFLREGVDRSRLLPPTS